VEALGSGKPVIACGRGGIVEIAHGEPAGYFFDRPNVEELQAAMERFEEVEHALDPGRLVTMARRYSHSAFEEKMWSVFGGPAVHKAASASV